jgi:hypothetical protein
MDRTESTVRKMLTAIEAPLYDIGVLSDRGMLPRLGGQSGNACCFHEVLTGVRGPGRLPRGAVHV